MNEEKTLTIVVETYPEQEEYWKQLAESMKRASKSRYFVNPYDKRDGVVVSPAYKDAPIINTRRAKWQAMRHYNTYPQFTNHFSTEQAAVNYTKKHGYKEIGRS